MVRSETGGDETSSAGSYRQHIEKESSWSVFSREHECLRVYYMLPPPGFLPLMQDELPLIAVPTYSWVGQFVRITTPKHKGVTGLVYTTENGWVRVRTSLGDLPERAYDLIVIPRSRADISGGLRTLAEGDESQGKRTRRQAPEGELWSWCGRPGPPQSTMRCAQFV